MSTKEQRTLLARQFNLTWRRGAVSSQVGEPSERDVHATAIEAIAEDAATPAAVRLIAYAVLYLLKGA